MSNIYGIRYSRHEYRTEYLQSQEWRNKSKFVLCRDPVCRVCDVEKSSDTHHLTYDRVPFEDLETDTIGVCRKCHNIIHRHGEMTAKFRGKVNAYQEARRIIAELRELYTISRNPIPVTPDLVDLVRTCVDSRKLRKASLVLSVTPAHLLTYLQGRKALNVFQAMRLISTLTGVQKNLNNIRAMARGTLLAGISPRTATVLERSRRPRKARKTLDPREPSVFKLTPEEMLVKKAQEDEASEILRATASKENSLAQKNRRQASQRGGRICATY